MSYVCPSLFAAVSMSMASYASGQQCFYGGNLDNRSALSSERNTFVTASWTFDDVDWPGGSVAGVWGNFASQRSAGTPVACDVAIFRGMSEGQWGEAVAQISDITTFTWTPTGQSHNGHDIFELRLDVSVQLPVGSFHVGVRPVGTGAGQYWIASTSGENSQGGPIGNGNAFFQSDFFGFPLPTDWRNINGPGPWDVSFGICGEAEPSVTLGFEGECPGVMTARVSGATPGGRIGLIRSSPGRCGGQMTIPPSNPCSGTVLPLGGAALVRIIIADGEGNAAVTGNVPGAVCGRVCLIALDLTTCEVSNVAEF